jgi:hypothetical protein
MSNATISRCVIQKMMWLLKSQFDQNSIVILKATSDTKIDTKETYKITHQIAYLYLLTLIPLS